MRGLVSLIALAALTACGGGESGGNRSSGAPVAAVAPPAGKAWSEVVSQTPEGGYVMGNPNAAVKLVEYGSRTCPTCGQFGRDAMEPLETKYVSTGKVSYEFRDFLVHGPPDLAATLLGQCGGTEPFFPILEQMYQNQPSYLEKLESAAELQQRIQGQPPERAMVAWAEHMGLIDFVKQRGIPEAKARACLSDRKAIDTLAKRMEEMSASGVVTGTPTFLINGKPVEGVVAWSQLEPALKDAGAR